MECSNCGEPLDSGDTICPACGALSVTDDPVWQAATADEAPTQVIPIVGREGVDNEELGDDPERTSARAIPVAAPASRRANRPEAVSPADTAHDRPAQDAAPAPPPPGAAPPPPDAAPSPRWTAIKSPRTWTWPRLSRQTVVGVLAGAAVVAILLTTALVVGRVLNAPIAANPSESPPSSLGANGTASPGSSPNEAGGAYGCSPTELTAPAAGRWRLFRAEFGPRDSYDYLRFNLRQQGGHEQAATVRVELLPPGDVQGRYGVQGPAEADIALVVEFGAAVDIGGGWGGQPRYGALRGFQIARGAEGRVYAVVGVRGDGCFSLSGGGWDAGQMNSQNDISLQIRKP